MRLFVVIKGIGTDICELARIESALARTPKLAKRLLTEAELQGFEASREPARFLAKRFAAKEAIAKALGTGIAQGISWQHIQIEKLPSGQPSVRLTNAASTRLAALEGTQVLLSYSDERQYVTAFALIQ